MFGITPVQETGETLLDNALIKARHAARVSRLPAIADDSGLEVDALRGAPGVQSARYAGPDATDSDNVRKLLAEMAGVPPPGRRACRPVRSWCSRSTVSKPIVQRRAMTRRVPFWPGSLGRSRFHCVLVFVRFPDDAQPLVAEGVWEGRLAERPRGEGGFGYDPVFEDPETGLTAAELSPGAKNARSHRGQAARRLRELLQRPVPG